MDITVVYEYSDPVIESMDIAGLAAFVAVQEGKPESTECSVSFVADETIAQLNEEYRGKQGPTDVLSFECDGLDDGFDIQADGESYQLGDVLIAPDVAKRQCCEYGTTLEQEIELLCVHGLLHLCGWDHVTDDTAEAMEARERQLLDAWRNR